MANAEDVFAHTALELDGTGGEEADAGLGALIHLYLRSTYDHDTSCWPGRDEHDTLRRTCHAVEVLYRLNFEADAVAMVREAGNWLINLPIRDRLFDTAERDRARLYPSRFKTLAYLRRFDDELVRKDFSDLLGKEVGGIVRGVTESDILSTSIVLDTLITLEHIHSSLRREVCSDERFATIVAALRMHFKNWRSANLPMRSRRPSGPLNAESPRRLNTVSEINNPRDLSYVLGLLVTIDQDNLLPRQVIAAIADLTDAIVTCNHQRSSDLGPALYSALQLAEHYRQDDAIKQAVQDLLGEVRSAYTTPETLRRWDFSLHTLVLRLMLTYYGEDSLTRTMVARLLRGEEQRRTTARSTLETELAEVIRERIKIEIRQVAELDGGFTADRILRVPFTYWYPMPGYDGDRPMMVSSPHEASVIIKRSTSDAFHTATENYRQLPSTLRSYFVRQPAESQVYKSDDSSAYYLTMEDLANLFTLEQIVNECDQRAMSDNHSRSLREASRLSSNAVFALFRETHRSSASFPGTQIARLYLSSIEGKLARATTQIPWLKNPLQGYYVGEQRFKGLDSYLTVINKHAHILQPHNLGLTHGDLHARNIMLDRNCTQLKLIDLDKLSWNGDYLADLGNLLTDVCVYRRVTQPRRDFGLPREEIKFVTKAEAGTAENAVRYPALGRPATEVIQEYLLAAIAQFAEELGDKTWRPRLWLASAAALFARIAFHTEKEVAAVLYGEAIRLLQDLNRYLENNQELPALLIPSSWPQSSSSYTGSGGDLPDWIATSAVLRAVDDGLAVLGLRHEYEHGTVSYYSTVRSDDGPVARLVPPRREGIGRILLPTTTKELPDNSVKVVRSSQPGDAFGTIAILTETTNTNDALHIVRTCLNGSLP